MSFKDLDDRYFDWLVDQVVNVKTKTRARTHTSLFRQLHKTIFVAFIPHDENRIADARDMKYEFLAAHEEEQGDLDWMRSPCSMLEIMLVLSRQLAFEMDDPVDVWFWHLLDEIGLEQYNDRDYDMRVEEHVAEILDCVVWRNYEPSGKGGFFPLQHPERDQRKVELWYQLNAYLLENF